MRLTKNERYQLEDKKLVFEVKSKRLDYYRLIVQIPLTTILLVLAIIEIVKYSKGA